MNKKGLQLLFLVAAFLILAVANIKMASAQSTTNHRYQISSTAASNSDAIVETSVSNDIISVAVQRGNQPTHYYSSFPEVLISTARIGKKNLFTVYHKDQRIEAGRFEKTLREVSGFERSQNNEIVAVRKILGVDMKILRAVRAYDKKADVILAELAYTIVTYDRSKIETADNDALKNFSVTELAPSSKINPGKDVSGREHRAYKKVSFIDDVCDQKQCIQDAYNRFDQCSTDNRITDKSICYNNRSAEVQTCYRSCDAPLITVIPATPLQIFMQRREQKEVGLR